MNAPSFQFLAFAAAGAVLFNLSAALVWRRLVLLALNLAFFAFFVTGVTAVLPYLGFLLLGYAAILVLRKYPTRAMFVPCLGLVLFTFFWLKCYTFVPVLFDLTFVYTTIGLSYVFFRVLHLVIEDWQGGLPDRISPLSYINYTLHFPALISGPIQLYPDYHRMESERPRSFDVFTLGQAVWRVALGFFKVMIISALLIYAQRSCIVSLTPDLPLATRVLDSALIGAIYPLFLYANFSGYTDFVIGAAQLYGFRLPENFDNPFVSENFIAFWSRWHITLSNWLKTYVYMPVLVACMRRVPSREAEPYFGVLAYFLTFFLVGAWHGQTSMFLFFGILQGGGVAANKLYQTIMIKRLSRKGYRRLCENALYRALSRGLTFSWFAFTLLWFWSSWGQLGTLISAAGPAGFALGWLLVFVTASLVLTGLVGIQAYLLDYSWLRERYVRTICATAMTVTVLTALAVVSGPAPDIVYKNF